MIQMVTIQTRECIEGDTGEVARAYYVVNDGVLTMCDEDGEPTGKPIKLQPDVDPRVAAARLLRQEMLKKPRSGFDGPLRYPRIGVA
jgi:hypothetical protein